MCMDIKVTHILTRHVPISNIDHLVAHFTPNIDSFEKVAARASQLRCSKEFQGMLESAFIYLWSIVVDAIIEVVYHGWETAFILFAHTSWSII